MNHFQINNTMGTNYFTFLQDYFILLIRVDYCSGPMSSECIRLRLLRHQTYLGFLKPAIGGCQIWLARVFGEKWHFVMFIQSRLPSVTFAHSAPGSDRHCTTAGRHPSKHLERPLLWNAGFPLSPRGSWWDTVCNETETVKIMAGMRWGSLYCACIKIIIIIK